MQFFHHVAHQAAPAQQVAAQLFNELLEARLALGAGGLLVSLGDWCADREVVADEQRQRLDLDVLVALQALGLARQARSEEHTSELQSLMRISYAVFCLKKKKKNKR